VSYLSALNPLLALESEFLGLRVDQEQIEGVVSNGGIGEDSSEPTHEEGYGLRDMVAHHPQFEVDRLGIGRLFKCERPG